LDGSALLAFQSALFGGASYAGPAVNERTAMQSTAVYRCVSLLAGLVGSLPLVVYERGEQGRRVASERGEHTLLHDEPNELMGSVTWREMLMVDLLLGGDHFSLIEYDGAGRVAGLLPLPRVSVDVRRRGRRNMYRVILAGGGAREFDQADILHVPGIGFDGLRSLSPIASAGKQAIGTALALDEAVGRMHANGAKPSGVLSVSPNTKPEAILRMKAQFEAAYAGVGNVGRTLFVDSGAKWEPMQLSPADAQLIEQRRFGISDICRIFGVPPHMVGETDKSTSWGSGIEQQTLGFLRFSLEPWLKRIEDELQRKLFKGSAFYAEFSRDALMAMDSAARREMYASAIQNGWMKPAEVRRLENLPPEQGADQLFINGTLRPIDQAGAPPASTQRETTP
jgi:HK97 family phage portal protein